MPPCYLSFNVFKEFAFQNALICPLWFIFIEIQIKLKAQGKGDFFLACGRETILISFKCILHSFVLAQSKHIWISMSFVQPRSNQGLQKKLFDCVCSSVNPLKCWGKVKKLPYFHDYMENYMFVENKEAWGEKFFDNYMTSRGC